MLIITTYARNGEGKRYFDTETKDAATEVCRFFVTHDWRLTVAPNQEEIINA